MRPSFTWPQFFVAKLLCIVGLGVLQTLVLSAVRYTPVGAFSLFMAIFVAVLMATLGRWIRGGKRRDKEA